MRIIAHVRMARHRTHLARGDPLRGSGDRNNSPLSAETTDLARKVRLLPLTGIALVDINPGANSNLRGDHVASMKTTSGLRVADPA
jgi:hypothetical protein